MKSHDGTENQDEDSPWQYKYGCHLCGTHIAIDEGGGDTIDGVFVRLCPACVEERDSDA